MRIAFVRPSMSGRPGSSDALQPLVFSLIAALTPADVEITFHDQMIEALPDDFQADALALTVETFAARTAYAIAARVRAAGIPVILGGYHPTALPDEAAEHADAVVIGEAEDTWPRIVADLRDGNLQSRYTSRNDADLTLRPATSVIDRRRYPPLGVVQFSRGCRYACEFCSIHGFFGHSIRSKPVDQVVAEVRERPERVLFFVDDNLFADKDRARALFTALEGAGKTWVCQITMDVAQDPPLLAAMRRAGCVMVLIGFESLDPANLQQMGKGSNLHAEYRRVLANIAAAGLMVYGTFVVGYDHDTAGTGRELVDFATSSGFSIANFNPLMPMPGTRLYDRLNDQGRLLHERWWLDPSFRYGDAMLQPASMSPQELTAACRDARYRFTSLGSITRRTMARANRRPRNLWLHLAMNLVSRREIRAKQGRALGSQR